MHKRATALPVKLTRKDHKTDDKGKRAKQEPRQQAKDDKSAHREQPNGPDAEKGISSSCLKDQSVVAEVSRSVPVSHICSPVQSEMFKAVVDMSRAGMKIDLLTYTQFLRDRGVLDRVGGAGYVTEIQDFVPTSANVSSYVEIVRQKFILREMISVGTLLIRRSYGAQEDDTADIIDQGSSLIERIRLASQGPNGSEKFDFSDLMSFDSSHDPNCLIGNRYIVRGGSSLWAGGSGYGKSSLQLQLGVYWACGIPCLALPPVRPIKPLLIQSA